MGDSVAIRFTDGVSQSVALVDHWGGWGTVAVAGGYIRGLRKVVAAGGLQEGPLSRGEPDTIMVDFVGHVTAQQKKPPMWASARLTDLPYDTEHGLHLINTLTAQVVECGCSGLLCQYCWETCQGNERRT